MKKSILSFGLLVAIGFSGCAMKSIRYVENTRNNDDYLIKIYPGSNSISWKDRFDKANILALEYAAEFTLQKGKKYFAFIYPKEVSNVRGVAMNTAKEFLETCNNVSYVEDTVSFVASLGFSTPNKCKIASTKRSGNGLYEIKMFDKKPLDFTVYDAKEVIDFLKKTKTYIPLDEYKIEKKNNPKRL